MTLPSSPSMAASVRDPAACLAIPLSGFSGDVYMPSWRGLYVLQCISAQVSEDRGTWRSRFVTESIGGVMKLFQAVTPKSSEIGAGFPDLDRNDETQVCRDNIAGVTLMIIKQCLRDVRVPTPSVPCLR